MYDKKPLSCAFGVHLKEQVQALENMEYLIKSMKINNKTFMLPFQKGILNTIKAIQGLYEVLHSSHGIEFLFSTHVNQDNLENLFSRLRSSINLLFHCHMERELRTMTERKKKMILSASARTSLLPFLILS